MTDITDQKPVSTNVNQIAKNDLGETNNAIETNNNSIDTTLQEDSGNTKGTTSSIKITVQGNDGAVLGSFSAKKGETIMALAQANSVEIPFSCGAGACGLCLCYIVQGGEYINKSYTTPSFMELDEDQVLTCIAAVKDECFDDENTNVEIILKRAY